MESQPKSQSFLRKYKQNCKDQLRIIQNMQFDTSIQSIVDRTLSHCNSTDISPNRKTRILKNSNIINRTPISFPISSVRSSSKIKTIGHKRTNTSVTKNTMNLNEDATIDNRKKSENIEKKSILETAVNSFNKQAVRLKQCINTKGESLKNSFVNSEKENLDQNGTSKSNEIGIQTEFIYAQKCEKCSNYKQTIEISEKIIQDYEKSFNEFRKKYNKINVFLTYEIKKAKN